MCDNDDLVLDVSVLSPFGKSDHSLIEMQVRCDINVDLKTYHYDYKNANFDMIHSVFNSDFNSQLNHLSDVNDQVCLLVNTLNEALAQAQHCTSKVKWCCKVKVKAKRKIMETMH